VISNSSGSFVTWRVLCDTSKKHICEQHVEPQTRSDIARCAQCLVELRRPPKGSMGARRRLYWARETRVFNCSWCSLLWRQQRTATFWYWKANTGQSLADSYITTIPFKPTKGVRQ